MTSAEECFAVGDEAIVLSDIVFHPVCRPESSHGTAAVVQHYAVEVLVIGVRECRVDALVGVDTTEEHGRLFILLHVAVERQALRVHATRPALVEEAVLVPRDRPERIIKTSIPAPFPEASALIIW